MQHEELACEEDRDPDRRGALSAADELRVRALAKLDRFAGFVLPPERLPEAVERFRRREGGQRLLERGPGCRPVARPERLLPDLDQFRGFHGLGFSHSRCKQGFE